FGKCAELRPGQVCFYLVPQFVIEMRLPDLREEGLQQLGVQDVVRSNESADMIAFRLPPQLLEHVCGGPRAVSHRVAVQAAEGTLMGLPPPATARALEKHLWRGRTDRFLAAKGRQSGEVFRVIRVRQFVEIAKDLFRFARTEPFSPVTRPGM